MDGTDLRPYRRSSHEMFKDDGGLCLLVEAHCGAVANHVGPFPECFPGEESRIQGLRVGEDSRCFLQRPEIAYAFLQIFFGRLGAAVYLKLANCSTHSSSPGADLRPLFPATTFPPCCRYLSLPIE